MVIDLDVVRPASAIPAKPRRPARYRVVAVAAFVLALAGGAAAPDRAVGITEVLTVDGQGSLTSLLTDEAYYTVRTDGHVEALPLCTGCPRWSSRTKPGQRLTVAGEDTLIVDVNETAQVTFLDARTGALRWRLDDTLAVDVIGGRVAAWDVEKHILQMRDLPTGRVLWSRPAFNYSADEAYAVILDEAGGATVVDAANGAELTPRRDLGLPNPAARLVGDRLIVFGGSYLAAFSRDGLSREWITATNSPYGVTPCGPGLLCAFGSAGLTVIDPADGSVRWTSPTWHGMGESGVLFEESGRSAVVDLATGRVERELGRSGPVGGLLLVTEPGRTSVIGLADGRVRGVLPLVLPSACVAAGPYLGCEKSDVTFTVWRLGR
ncbi:outer membrane protein assembly factor BamB family protein [Paractinoplanes hotanensis]|uniref:PQQ-like beta-propeller repeat protein n=1 Tax=Paractinoplanes hotanensis TaxID=2906497 RepID=A0ABT0Y6I0_9ACTN|nr:PQQ-binding-like beta-propeller repeat protein [Actinoplanes hotanensis]MCM4081643.1 PQQ-like beta-propeller repeat protein [Actinoplanes hotanensis]